MYIYLHFIVISDVSNLHFMLSTFTLVLFDFLNLGDFPV